MQIDRRTLLGSAIALVPAAHALAGLRLSTKAQAIEALTPGPDFQGIIAYGRAGRVEHVRCVGMADVEAGRGITAGTRFRWGSATKWLVSVAVLRVLADRGLSLSTPIGSLLPLFRADTGAHVQVQHLLSNTSGIPDLLSRQVAAEPALRTSTASCQTIIDRFAGGDLDFAPGQGWSYAALNWVIVAGILERVTGKQLPEVVRDAVFRPLGMSSAGFVQSDRPALPSLAAAYARLSPPVRKMSDVPPFLAASGTAASTVGDAMRAADGIFSGSLLSAGQRDELIRIRWPAEEYALGGRVVRVDGVPWAWEAGKVGGYRALIAHRLGARETIVIFSNSDMKQSAISALAQTIARA